MKDPGVDGITAECDRTHPPSERPRRGAIQAPTEMSATQGSNLLRPALIIKALLLLATPTSAPTPSVSAVPGALVRPLGVYRPVLRVGMR